MKSLMELPIGYMKKNLRLLELLIGVPIAIKLHFCDLMKEKCQNFLWMYMVMSYIKNKKFLNILRQERRMQKYPYLLQILMQ